MPEFKSISRDAVPLSLEKAERYRLLNEPAQAESVCRDVLAADFDLAFVLTGGREVIGKLHPQPRLLRAAECLRQPYSHLRTDSGFAVDHVV